MWCVHSFRIWPLTWVYIKYWKCEAILKTGQPYRLRCGLPRSFGCCLTLQLYLACLAIGVETGVMNSFTGNVLRRLKAAFDKGDLETARLEQVSDPLCSVTGNMVIEEPHFRPTPFPLSWQFHPQHSSPNRPIIFPSCMSKPLQFGLSCVLSKLSHGQPVPSLWCTHFWSGPFFSLLTWIIKSSTLPSSSPDFSSVPPSPTCTTAIVSLRTYLYNLIGFVSMIS